MKVLKTLIIGATIFGLSLVITQKTAAFTRFSWFEQTAKSIVSQYNGVTNVWQITPVLLRQSAWKDQQPALSAHELGVIRSIASRYVNPNTNYVPAYTYDAGGSGYYRPICSQALMSFISKRSAGQPILPTDPEFILLKQLGIPDANGQSDFYRIRQPSGSGFWLAGASGFVCLLAVDMARDVFTPQTMGTILQDAAALARDVYQLQTVNYYKSTQQINAGNSQAEEVGVTASFLLAAAKILPDSHLSATERQNFINRAAELIAYSFSECANECPFRPSAHTRWLVANHQLDPHPIYTQSLLHFYAEVVMLHHQFGETLPEWLPPESVINNIAAALQGYVNSNFQVSGEYNLIRGDGSIHSTRNFANEVYTNFNSLFPPTDRLDAFGQFFQGTLLKGYVFRDGRVWNFNCVGGSCDAMYSKTLAELWAGVTNQANWTVPIPTDKIDSVDQFVDLNGDVKAYIFRDNRVWHYLCANNACPAQYTKTLAEFWQGIGNQAAFGVPLPTDRVDGASSFYSGTTQKNYVYKDNYVWSYNCDANGCTALYSKTLAEIWQGVANQNIWSVPIPTDRIDAIGQYIDGTTIKAYIYKNDRVWAYTCQTTGGCTAFYDKRIQDQWNGVNNQQNWRGSVFQVYTGVTDWGYDASIQSSAYAAMGILAPNYLSRYIQMQTAQANRGLLSHPTYASRYEYGQWSWGELISTKNTGTELLRPLTDGWQSIDYLGNPTNYTPATMDEMINSHWWANSLQGFNSSVAYLLTTATQMLGKFPSSGWQ